MKAQFWDTRLSGECANFSILPVIKLRNAVTYAVHRADCKQNVEALMIEEEKTLQCLMPSI
jgi:hypothetical protein